MYIRVFHFLLFFSECLISTGFPLFHLFNAGLAFLPAKSIVCHLPVLTGLNRQKVAENGKNENDPLAPFTCF